MHTTIEFEFDLPEQQEQFDILCRHQKLHSAVWDFREWMRSQYKYGNYEGEALEMLERIRNNFYENVNEWLE